MKYYLQVCTNMVRSIQYLARKRERKNNPNERKNAPDKTKRIDREEKNCNLLLKSKTAFTTFLRYIYVNRIMAYYWFPMCAFFQFSLVKIKSWLHKKRGKNSNNKCRTSFQLYPCLLNFCCCRWCYCWCCARKLDITFGQRISFIFQFSMFGCQFFCSQIEEVNKLWTLFC